MTAVNAIVCASAVHMVADGVCWRPGDDTVAHFAAKVATLPHLSAAVAVSGPTALVHTFADILHARATDLDEVIASFDETATLEPGRFARAIGDTTRVLIAGWSRAHGPSAWVLAGSDRFHRVGPGQVWLSPAVAGWGPPGPTADMDAPAFEASCVELVTRQRRAYPVVGGFVSLTTIRPASIEQKILHRWPDRVGAVMGSQAA